MHPRTHAVLSELCAAAQALVRAPAPRGYQEDQRKADALLSAVLDLQKMPDEDGERLIDDTTVWLAQAVRNAEREGPLGEPMKWTELARVLLKFVQTDLAVAIERSHGIPPATTRGRS